MRRLLKWCQCRNERLAYAVSVCYALMLVAGMIGGGAAIGFLYAWNRADTAHAQQRKDYQQSLKLISGNVATAATATAETAEQLGQTAQIAKEAATTAKDAAQAASGAATGARSAVKEAKGAATTARAAASTVKGAAADLDAALNPSPAPRDAPKWLDGP